MKLIDRKTLATDVVIHDDAPETVNTDARGYARLGWMIVLVGFVGFLLWASFAPLDKGVPLSGFVAKESNRKTVQHLTGGTVEDILVKDGDHVKAGQVLVRMNGVQARAESEVDLAQYFAARAAEARLMAERDGANTVAFPATLARYKDNPQAVAAFNVQKELFESRRDALRNELAAIDESIAGIKAQVQGTQASQGAKREQLGILKEQLTNMRDLAKDGYVARSRLLDLERTYSQIQGSLSEDAGNIGRGQRQVAELTLKRAQRMQESQRDSRAQLSDVQKEANALLGRVEAADYAVRNLDVKAPVDGIVLGVNVFTRGGVISPGFHLMDVVPTADALVIEGQLPVNLIDRVHPGLPVEFIFAAFNASTTPHIAGEVTTVAADRSLDEKSGAPYYKVTARVTAEGLKVINEKHLVVQPGMPVQLFVRTGERTMMNYLLKPLFDRAHIALTED
jgi:protease secretion system membrane fusion protein